MKYLVTFFTRVEIEENDSFLAEQSLAKLIPTTQSFERIGKVHSIGWETELIKNEAPNRPTEQPINK